MHPVGNPFQFEVIRSLLRRAEKQFGDMIRQYAIDLLRHFTIETAQASFHMRYGYLQFGCDQCPG